MLAVGPAVGSAQSVEGRVVRVLPSGERSGLAQLPVQFHRVSSQGGGVVDSALTGSGGRFEFPLGSVEKAEEVYLVSTRYEGVLYAGPAVHAGLPGTEPYEIAVYDTAVITAPARLELTMRHVVLVPLDGGLQVAEFLDLAGGGGRTLVAADPSVPVWSAGLSRGAHGIVARSSGGLIQATVAGEVVRVDDWLTPAGARLSVEYVLPGDRYELELDQRTERLEVIVSAGGRPATAEGLSAAPSSNASVQRFTGSGLEPGSRVVVRVPSRGGGGPWVWIWLTAGLGLCAGAAVAWRLGQGGGASAAA